MGKRIVKWKPTPGKNLRDEDCELPFPDLLDSSTGWTILERIFHMERKTPISFADAAQMALEKYMEARSTRGFGHAPGQAHWYTKNFISWISSLGFHIELTGDEFELYGSGTPNA